METTDFITADMIQDWLLSSNPPSERVREVAKQARQGGTVSLDCIRKWQCHPKWRIRLAALYAWDSKKWPESEDVIRRALLDNVRAVRLAAFQVCKELPVSLDVVHTALSVLESTTFGNNGCKIETLNTFQEYDIPEEAIREWMRDPNHEVRWGAMTICKTRKIPLDIIERGLFDPVDSVRLQAKDVCAFQDIPSEKIQEWASDPCYIVRGAAMRACLRKEIPQEVPAEIIENGLRGKGGGAHMTQLASAKTTGFPRK